MIKVNFAENVVNYFTVTVENIITPSHSVSH